MLFVSYITKRFENTDTSYLQDASPDVNHFDGG